MRRNVTEGGRVKKKEQLSLRYVSESRATGGHKSRFSDEQSTGYRGTLLIIFFDYRKGRVAVIGTVARQGRHNNSVLDRDIADLERSEEF